MTQQREITREDIQETYRLKAVVDGKSVDLASVEDAVRDETQKAAQERDKKIKAAEDERTRKINKARAEFNNIKESGQAKVEDAKKEYQAAVDALRSHQTQMREQTGAAIDLMPARTGGRTNL